MKRILYIIIVLILVVSGVVFVSFEPKINHSSSSIAKPLTMEEKQLARKKWEATPEGILFKKWEASVEGKKVQASADKIRKSVKDFTTMKGEVISLTLPPGSRVGFGIMVKINGDDYILAFGPENSNKKNTNSKNEFEQLHKLKVKDKISIKSHHVSKAPKYAYPIIAGDYIEKNNKVIYERVMGKGGC
jgi:hypothetical protein